MLKEDILDYRFQLLKYYRLWTALFDIKGIGHEWAVLLMRNLWEKGQACAFIPELPEGTEKQIWISDFALTYYNGSGWPSRVEVINDRNVPGYPTGEQSVNCSTFRKGKVAVMYAFPSQEPVRKYFLYLVDKIKKLRDQVEQNNEQVVLPMGIPTTSNKEQFSKELERAMIERKAFIKVNAESSALFNPTPLAGVYVSDKLLLQIDRWDNEARTILGIDSSGAEKRERVNMDEANSNNGLINMFQETLKMQFKAFEESINALGGPQVKFTYRGAPAQSVSENGVRNKEGEDDGETTN